MFSATVLLAIILALAVSVVLALCLPVWASISIALAAVVTVAIGGGALLAKVGITATMLGLGAWLARSYMQRRTAKRMAAQVKWLAIPEVSKEEEQAPARRAERRAA